MSYQFENSVARDGNPVLTVIDGEKRIRLNSAYRPMEEAKKWASQYETKYFGMLILVFGVGNGIFLNALLERCEEDAKIIVYEPCEELFHFVREQLPDSLKVICDDLQGSPNPQDNQNPQRNSVRLRIVTPSSGQTLYEVLNEEMTWEGRKLSIVHPQYDALFPKEYQKFLKEFEDAKKRVEAQKNTANAFGKKILKNQLYMLKQIRKLCFLPDLEGRLDKRKPLVLVSSGPSLADSIEDLRAVREFVTILAVDSSVNFLVHRKILPDFIISIDPNKWAMHFVKEEAKKTPLLCRMDSNLNILKSQEAPLIVFGSSAFAVKVLESAKKLPQWVENTGGSVSTAALSVCEAVGIETVILIGQDLCYRMQDGNTIVATHANGKISPDEKKQGFERGIIEGNDDTRVVTRQDWYRYLKWTEAMVQQTKMTVINATVGGAKINGCLRMTLKEAVERYRGQSEAGLQKNAVERYRSPSEAGLPKNAVEQYRSPSEAGLLKNAVERYRGQLEDGLQKNADGMCPALSGGFYSEEEYQVLEKLVGSFPELSVTMKETAQKVMEESQILAEAAKNRTLMKPKFQPMMKDVSEKNQWLEQQILYDAIDLLIPREEADEMGEVGKDTMDDYRITYEQVGKIYKKMISAIDELNDILDTI